MTRWATAAICVFALSCNYEPDVVQASDHEGDNPGECSDGADNDIDGYFDCQDNECFFSPACMEEGDTDTDTDTDSDTDSDTDTDVSSSDCGAYLDTVDLTYTLFWDVDDPLNAGGAAGIHACTMVFDGTGTLETASGSRATFKGTYTERSSDCPSALAQYIYSPTVAVQYHSFHWNSACDDLEEWAVHESAGSYSSARNADYYINQLYESWTPGVTVALDHNTRELAPLGLESVGITVYTDHTLEATFTK